MSTADGQTFARDLRDSQGRQLLKPRIAVSKFENGAAPGSVPPWMACLRAQGSKGASQRRLSCVPLAEGCDEVANKIKDRLTAAALGAEFGSSSLTVSGAVIRSKNS
jgi:hypothetical protein